MLFILNDADICRCAVICKCFINSSDSRCYSSPTIAAETDSGSSEVIIFRGPIQWQQVEHNGVTKVYFIESNNCLRSRDLNLRVRTHRFIVNSLKNTLRFGWNQRDKTCELRVYIFLRYNFFYNLE